MQWKKVVMPKCWASSQLVEKVEGKNVVMRCYLETNGVYAVPSIMQGLAITKAPRFYRDRHEGVGCSTVASSCDSSAAQRNRLIASLFLG